MSPRGHHDPDRWIPTTGTLQHRRPAPGQLVGWRYAAWTVAEVTPRADVDLTDADRAKMKIYKPDFRERHRPYHVILAHHRGPVLVAGDALRRLHDGTITVHLGVGAGGATWRLLEPRYAVCSCHGEPHPCGELVAERVAAVEARKLDQLLSRHEPGVCFACRELVTTRAPAITFPEPSPYVPGAGPVTFHARRRGCWSEARRHELNHRHSDAPRLASCPGVLFIHTGDGRAECTADQLCTGHHGPPCSSKIQVPITALECTTRAQYLANDGGYPRPPGVCAHERCLGRDHSTGAPDPFTAGDEIDNRGRGHAMHIRY